MRKTAAILLLVLFVLNTIGYKLWFTIAIHRATDQLVASLDRNDYNERQLFTLKVPLDMPYQNYQSGYERIDGEISINGETYRYVQRKVENDTLVLQCIRHHQKILLQQKADSYAGEVNEQPTGNDAKKMPGKNSAPSKFSASDFTNDINPWKLHAFSSLVVPYTVKPFPGNSYVYLQKLIKPPQAV